jgi:hypothetical protein
MSELVNVNYGVERYCNAGSGEVMIWNVQVDLLVKILGFLCSSQQRLGRSEIRGCAMPW